MITVKEWLRHENDSKNSKMDRDVSFVRAMKSHLLFYRSCCLWCIHFCSFVGLLIRPDPKIVIHNGQSFILSETHKMRNQSYVSACCVYIFIYTFCTTPVSSFFLIYTEWFYYSRDAKQFNYNQTFAIIFFGDKVCLSMLIMYAENVRNFNIDLLHL